MQALIYSAGLENRKVRHLRSIFVSTSGIIFLSTPHYGTDPARWRRMLQSLCKTALPNGIPIHSTQLIDALETQSTTLQDINISFTSVMSRFRMFFFHETVQTCFGESSDYIVDQSSAAPELEGAEYAGIEATHLDICRFESEDSPGYELVAEAVKHWAKETPHLITARWGTERSLRQTCSISNVYEYIALDNGEMKGDLNMWLTKAPTTSEKKEEIQTMLLSLISTFDTESQHRHFRKMVHKGTCRWILENPNFEKWFRGEQSSCLWCSGIPGAGKTVLTSVIIHHAKLRHGKVGSALAFFYCTSFEPETLTASTILGSFIIQLMLQFEKLFKPLPEVLMEKVQRAHDERRGYFDTDELIELLLVFAANSLETYFILDGLDECTPEEREKVFSFFKRLLQRKATGSTYRVLVSSRDEVNVIQEIPSCTRLSIRDTDINGDICEYVRSTVDDLLQRGKLKVRDDRLIADIKEKLINGAQVMFLWVEFQIRDLCNEGKNDLMIRRLLDMLPKDLNEIYRRCLEKIRGGQATKSLAHEALKWVCHAMRPLRVEELEEAIAFGPDDSCWDGNKIPNVDIVAICANLVVLDGTEKLVRLAHHTVKEFLFSKGRQNPDEFFSFEFHRTNLEVGESCVRYLSFFPNFRDYRPARERGGSFLKSILPKQRSSTAINRQSQTLLSMPLEVDSSKYKLLDYASANWVIHTVQISKSSPAWGKFQSLALQEGRRWTAQHSNQTNGIVALACCSQFRLAVEIEHMLLLRLLKDEYPRGFKDLCRQGMSNGSSALHVVAKGGSIMACKLLLQVCDVNKSDAGGKTALHWSATQKHEEIVRLLLNKGAEIGSRDNKGQVALHVAAYSGHESVVRLLIKKGADVNAKNSDGWTALRWAAREGHEAVVRLLIGKGADVNAKDNRDELTALRLAAQEGHEAVAQLLIEKGADVNAKESDGSMALHLAALKGYKAVVRLLIEKGADVNAKDNRDELTALRLAAQEGHEAVAQLLIERGADVNAKDSGEWAALHWAAQGGHKAVVQLLIKKGTDVSAKGSYRSMVLHLAAMNGHEAVVQLLIEKGADVNVKDGNRSTALHKAAQGGHEAVARLLIKKGADVSAKGSYGSMALHLAARNGREAVVPLLIEKGADVNAKDGNGSTALHFAAREGREAVVQLLIEGGAGVNVKDSGGWTALRHASLRGHGAMVKLLRRHGAV
ncbi:MAG: hypothetical protein M1839_009612 [Geoglossum umbratile]|nr:MAG: hypothetical protein M1839_009612 [Geoglossum umbratile]